MKQLPVNVKHINVIGIETLGLAKLYLKYSVNYISNIMKSCFFPIFKTDYNYIGDAKSVIVNLYNKSIPDPDIKSENMPYLAECMLFFKYFKIKQKVIYSYQH